MVTVSPLMLSARDETLLGVSRRSDAMGTLSVWSTRARELVPHLTEQTTEVRGFQILVEIFRLWTRYEPLHPQHTGRLDEFFLLVEQAFGRMVARRAQDWSLPGARRVRARMNEPAYISLADPAWHLLGGQKTNGIWGLYRGAARRAGLLVDQMDALSIETQAAADAARGFDNAAERQLFRLVSEAMDGDSVALPTSFRGSLARHLCSTFNEVPLADHLKHMLLDVDPLNRQLADRLLIAEGLDHRELLSEAAESLPAHRLALVNSIRCENVLAVVDSVFAWLCASTGKTLKRAVKKLPVDRGALAAACAQFADSGAYGAGTAATRHTAFHQQLDTSSHRALAQSVLRLHQAVSETRGRAAWIWEEGGILCGDVDVERPTELHLQVGVAWRNDYYLYPLQRVARQLAELSQ